MEITTGRSKAISGNDHILLVTAHPDDEVMFFSPLLENAASKGARVSILCLSTGNFDGLGETRAKELVKCAALYHIRYEDVHVVDSPDMQDGMDEIWPAAVVAQNVEEVVNQSNPNVVVTFDERGASYHPNHISTYHGKAPFFFRVLNSFLSHST
jgi:N-acetylglucosaminylphosphatidylinositol deacetylase